MWLQSDGHNDPIPYSDPLKEWDRCLSDHIFNNLFWVIASLLLSLQWIWKCCLSVCWRFAEGTGAIVIPRASLPRYLWPAVYNTAAPSYSISLYTDHWLPLGPRQTSVRISPGERDQCAKSFIPSSGSDSLSPETDLWHHVPLRSDRLSNVFSFTVRGEITAGGGERRTFWKVSWLLIEEKLTQSFGKESKSRVNIALVWALLAC